MNKAVRTPVIAGNWKMNNDRPAARATIQALIPLVENAQCEVVLFVPFTDLADAIELTKDTNIAIGAQNVHFAPKGAYTGEISLPMLQELGCEYVLVGHSERRQYFGETDESCNQKLKLTLAAKMPTVLCVGETLEQREAGQFETTVAGQVNAALEGVDPQLMRWLTIAYEPVWAIGTGKTATAAEAAEACAFIRGLLWGYYSGGIAASVPILYGGSMNAENCRELLMQVDVDGGLIGGASLKPEQFAQIVAAADELEDADEDITAEHAQDVLAAPEGAPNA